MGEFKLGRMTLKGLFSKPATKMYPFEAPEYYPETKGHIVIDADRCRYDGSCANLCPTGAIEVDRKELTWSIDRFRCIQCRNCVHVCVEEALLMANDYASPATEHVREVFTVTPEERINRERIAAEKAAKAAKLREEALKKKAAAEAAAKDTSAADKATPASDEKPAKEPAQKSTSKARTSRAKKVPEPTE